jgi:hypothetical protein
MRASSLYPWIVTASFALSAPVWGQADAELTQNGIHDSLHASLLATESIDVNAATQLELAGQLGVWDARVSRRVFSLLQGDPTGDEASTAAVMVLFALQHERPAAALLGQAWLDAGSGRTSTPPSAPDPEAGPPPASDRLTLLANYLEAFDGLVLFEDLPPVAPMDAAELRSWTLTLRRVYFEPTASPAYVGSARQRLEGADPVDLIPAYLNALLGCDLTRPDDVRATHALVVDFLERVAYFPAFSFPTVRDDPELERDPRTFQLRWVVLKAWRSWWVNRSATAESLADYRSKLAAKRRAFAERPAGSAPPRRSRSSHVRK